MDPLRRKNRHRRARARLKGTSARPRVSVFRGARRTTLQFIDDSTGRTLLALRDESSAKATKTMRAQELGKQAAAAAKKKKITHVVFDRSGYAYHGRVKAIADALREGGLNF